LFYLLSKNKILDRKTEEMFRVQELSDELMEIYNNLEEFRMTEVRRD